VGRLLVALTLVRLCGATHGDEEPEFKIYKGGTAKWCSPNEARIAPWIRAAQCRVKCMDVLSA
jgi:hypothetical protein